MSSAPSSTLSTSPSLSATSLAESVSSIKTTVTSCIDDSSSLSTDSSISSGHSIRPNEHLAILMPRSLWKRDSLSSSCDTFSCPTIFSSFPTFLMTSLFPTLERRHHCRKCGGVFCSKCTSRTTPLLDVNHLPFLNPPRNTSIYDFVSAGGIVDSHARVCDDCWGQLHGTPSMPQTPELKLSMLPMPQTLCRSSVVFSGDSSPASSTYPRTPPDTSLLVDAILSSNTSIVRRSNTDRSLNTTSQPPSNPLPLGELSTYPLCRSSLLCKASGGGRWVPRPAPTLGIGKALWEVEWEREIRRERRRKENPVIRDGGFCYRVYRRVGGSKSDEDDYDLERGLRNFSLSTF
ncbi:hypothetical protein C8R42DRAFT_582863 [Lentinula raphanica]|nr:hypothetical protein C8R42DRAFT_582863 [Lentinula raphanica]